MRGLPDTQRGIEWWGRPEAVDIQSRAWARLADEVTRAPRPQPHPTSLVETARAAVYPQRGCSSGLIPSVILPTIS